MAVCAGFSERGSWCERPRHRAPSLRRGPPSCLWFGRAASRVDSVAGNRPRQYAVGCGCPEIRAVANRLMACEVKGAHNGILKILSSFSPLLAEAVDLRHLVCTAFFITGLQPEGCTKPCHEGARCFGSKRTISGIALKRFLERLQGGNRCRARVPLDRWATSPARQCGL